MARDMVELLPGAEWKGRQRLTLPPAPVLHELHPMLHAPQAPPPSVLSEVRGIVVDVLSVAADWTDFVAAELERMLGGSRLQEGHESHMDGPVDWNALALQWRQCSCWARAAARLHRHGWPISLCPGCWSW